MKAFTEHGKPVDIDVGGDGPDDLMIVGASYIESDDPVSDHDIAWIERNFQEDMYFCWLEAQIGRAESMYEGDQ